MAQLLTVIGMDEANWSDKPDVKDPAQHDTTLSHSTAIMIWALMEEKKINLLQVIKDAMHKVHVGKRQSLALPCLIMKIAHSNRIPKRLGDEMFQVPRAARYIPYGDWDGWGIHLKKRKKRSEAGPSNPLTAPASRPTALRRAPDLGYVMQSLHQVLQEQRRINRRCQNV
ncbi:hypothetical protein PIB30_098678 [Stylosanthes scabra]|uniref:Uncharacterized protein n=1 Tax=Stylosanthes scabra TaxID=79078 RepID=A0ABU6RWJ9_9FABA|nr:hypothetical protein [Stylosanthes scabra]